MSARKVTLVGGSPWGFRMHGGHDLLQPLRISRVNPGSKAAQQGVREGDLISSINERSTRDLTNSEAHALLRNAGDHLKLGLNQENVGSPKRRIYRSSLQENTSTETLKKTTTKTTTSNTRVISTEPKSNGTDDTKNDRSYFDQNGGLKSAQVDQTIEPAIRGSERFESPDYTTDAEECIAKMPQNSRSRKNRRNRNRKRFQPASRVTSVVQNGEEIPERNSRMEREESSDSVAILENVNDLAEAKVNGNAVRVTTEKSDFDRDVVLESKPRNKFKIEKRAMKTETMICEISTIRNLPCEARIDHIAGVGILETSLTKSGEPTITVIEPIEPLSNTLTSKVETLGERNFAKALLAKKHSLEIHEVSDSDVETDNSRVVVVEAESDVEREPIGELAVPEEDPEEAKAAIDTLEPKKELGDSRTTMTSEKESQMPREVEERLRSFIEGLELPSSPEEAREECRKVECERAISCGISGLKKSRKRAMLESYFSQTQAANRFLDIIQEEGEKLSEDDEQHIRDFINEEISKYRREESRERIEEEEEEEEEEEKRDAKEDNTRDEEVESSSALIQEMKQQDSLSTEAAPSLEAIAAAQDQRQDDSDDSPIKDVAQSSVEERPVGRDVKENGSTDEKIEREPPPPPPPPKRSSSYNNDSEPHRPPTPPEIDYATDLTDIPPLPQDALSCASRAPACPPAPPIRGKTVHFVDIETVHDPPKRPPPPHDNPCTIDPGQEEPTIYENVVQRKVDRKEGLQSLSSPPPFPPSEVTEDRDRARVRTCESNVKTERNTVDFIKTLLTVLSRHDTTSQDVRNVLSGFDVAQLPGNIREIIDDLMAPSSRASTESDSMELRNGTVDGNAETGNDARLEIAHDRTYEVPRRSARLFAHSTPRQVSSKRCEIKKEYRSETWSKCESSDVETRADQRRTRRSINEEKHDTEIVSEDKGGRTVKQSSERREEKSANYETKVIGPETATESRYNCEREQKTEEKRSSELRVVSNQSEILRNECERSRSDSERCFSSSNGKTNCDFQEAECATTALSPTDFQGAQDSSSSTATISTVKYEAACSPLADAAPILREDGSESPRPGRRLHLLKKSFGEQTSMVENELDSPQPIPYSPLEDLYYVPFDEPPVSSVKDPELLKDLCIGRILSVPYGARLMDELTNPKYNIFKNLNTIQESVKGRAVDPDETTTSKGNKTIQRSEKKESRTISVQEEEEEMTKLRKVDRAWVGVPTVEDPRVLVCLSPSQQESKVRTNADNLLDLHKKYLERRGYHEASRRHEASPQSYRLQVRAPSESECENEMESVGGRWSGDWHIPGPGNRLLEIIKENSPSSRASSCEMFGPRKPNLVDRSRNAIYDHYGSAVPRTMKRVPSLDENQDRLKATSLSNWLNLARRNSLGSSSIVDDAVAAKMKTADSRLLIERPSGNKREACDNAISQANGERAAIGEEVVGNGSCGGRYVNSALIDRSFEAPFRSATPFRRSPISSNSAIIDKSRGDGMEVTDRRTARKADTRHNVNPALINDRPEVPPKVKRPISVDRSCIDTTSIFDKTPPRSHLEPRRYHDAGATKKVTNSLKQLQTNAKEHADQRRRYSLPQEYIDRQLRYIEQLEGQLKSAILAEEEEEDDDEEDVPRRNDREPIQRPHSVIGESRSSEDVAVDDDDATRHRETWHEESRNVTNGESEITNKDGYREASKRVSNENGVTREESGRCEKKEELYVISKRGDIAHRFEPNDEKKTTSALATNGEVFRQRMYDEYVHKVQEREQRKHRKVIKISSHADLGKAGESVVGMNNMEKEFIEKARNRMNKFGIRLDESESEAERTRDDVDDDIEAAKCLIDGREIRDAKKLPKHLQEFLKLSAEIDDDDAGEKGRTSDLLHEIDTALKIGKGFLLSEENNMFAPTFKASATKPGVWSPGSELPPKQPGPEERGKDPEKDAVIPPIWTPASTCASPVSERKEFRPVQFESPTLSRRNKVQSQASTEEAPPPWEGEEDKREASQVLSQTISSRIVNSHSAPAQGLNALVNAPRLPRAQNPTITLLQKAREGQLPKGAAYLDENINNGSSRIKNDDKPLISPGEIIYTLKKEYESEPETENEAPKKMADLGPRKFEGIGPTTKDGIPLVLRSEVKENNQAKWYKKMYDSLHRADKDEDYITIRYKPRRGTRYGYGSGSGYLSEPEPRGYSDRSATLDCRRRLRNKENDFSTSTVPRKNGPLKYSSDVYRNQPGRIEDYEPGRSSIAEKETKEWWDEVMDIFDGWLDENGRLLQGRDAEEPIELRRLSHSAGPISLSYRPDSRNSPFDQHNTHTTKPYMSHALKESGYESDSTLVFRRREDVNPLSPLEQRLAYKTVQRGGDVPLHGLRKPAPERPKDDSEIEYFPISPTLTRIRVHKTSAVPATSSSTMIFARYKRSAPSLASSSLAIGQQSATSKIEVASRRSRSTPSRMSSPPAGRPPSPPRRRSSRYNSTLRLYSSRTTHIGDRKSSNPRHEQCFAADDVSNIRFLRDRLSCKLEKQRKDREEAQRLRIARTSSASPVVARTRVTSSVSANFPSGRRSEPCLSRSFSENLSFGRTERPRARASISASPVARSSKIGNGKRVLEEKPPFVRRVPSKSPVSVSSRESTTDRLYSPERTCHHHHHHHHHRGSRLIETSSTTPKKEQVQLQQDAKTRRARKEQEVYGRLGRSSDLSSPAVVRKVIQRQKDVGTGRDVRTKVLPSGTVVKSSTALYASAANGKQNNPEDKSLKVTVAISSKGRELLCRTTETSNTSRYSGSKTSSTTSSPLVGRKTTFVESVETSSDVNRRKRLREKPQTIVRSPIERTPETITMNPEEIDKKSEKKRVRRERNGDTSKGRRSSSGKKSDSEGRKKMRKALGKAAGSEVAKELNKLNAAVITMEEIKRHGESIKSDAFFQRLFLGSNGLSPTPSRSSVLKKLSVLERARMFQDPSDDNFKSESSVKSLGIYLANKRPVSNSKFKCWEREGVSSRCSSPYGIGWPGRPVFRQIGKFDSLLSVDDGPVEFGSVASFRGRSPDLTRDRYKERSLSEPPLKVLTENPEERRDERPTSPSPVRSPACRRIQSLRQHQDASGTTIVRVKPRARSAGEVEQCRRALLASNLSLTRSTSSLSLSQIDREDYQRYVLERLHCRQKSARYKELQDFYASLERMGELERTASSGDLRPRSRNEEIIDYDRWREVRSKERAERELEILYGKLRAAQKERNFLFRPKEIDRFRWRGDSGLRCKEKSVENIREHFRKLEREESELESTRRREIASRKDVYKPLWRGSSVVNVANAMTRRATLGDIERSDRPSLRKSLGGSIKFWSSLSIEQVNALKNQLNEIYSNESPGRGKARPASRSDYEIVVPVEEEFGEGLREDGKGLYVRCHSLATSDVCKLAENVDENADPSPLKRSGSIGRGRIGIERSQSDRAVAVPTMSELEKKRLSLNLSKELLDMVGRKRPTTSVAPRETRGAIAAAAAATTTTTKPKNSSDTSPRTCYSVEVSDEGKPKDTRSDFLLVLTPDSGSVTSKLGVENVLEEWSKKVPVVSMTMSDENIARTSARYASASEFDSTTESSDASVRTVIRRDNGVEDPKRVEEREVAKEPKEGIFKLGSFSQSFADLKELFGETESARYATLPFYRSTRPRSTSPRRRTSPSTSTSTLNAHQFHSRSQERVLTTYPSRATSTSSCSLESLWQRSSSPDPERYWRAYLKLVKSGAVKKLRAKFESLEELTGERAMVVPVPKRFQSDPELTRDLLNKGLTLRGSPDVSWLRRKYEPVRGRARKRGTSPPIPRIPLRMEDLGMPRINVISKMAELKETSKSVPPGKSIETRKLEEERHVGRIREKFERDRDRMSILGEMFTSAPNVHELRDVAPYLAGQWVAHKYPSRGNHARSLSSPELKNQGRASREEEPPPPPPPENKKLGKPRATSSSPIRPRRPPPILKQPTTFDTDLFANQPFDPSKHRPRYRYQPPPPPPPPTVHRETRPWWPPIPTYTARPTVTFEGPASL